MESRIKTVVVGAAVLFSFFICANAFALSKGYQLGPIKIKPSIDVSVEYNSNAELKSSDTESGFVYKVTPGIGISFGTGMGLKRQTKRLYFNTNYSAEASHLEGKEFNFTHTVGGVVRYNISPLTSIGIHDTYRQTPTDLLGEDHNKTYDYNTATASLKHLFSPRLTSEAYYANSFYDSETTDAFDEFKDNIYGLAIDYKISKKINSRLDLSQGERDFEDSNDASQAARNKDYNIKKANLGLNYDLTRRTTIGASVGYTEREYTDSADDTQDVIYGANLTSHLTNFSTLRIDYSYAVLDTYNYPDPLGFVAPFNRQIDVASGLDPLYKYIDVNRVGATLTYNLTERDTVKVNGSYAQNKASALQSLGTDAVHRNADLEEEAYMASIGYTRKFTPWLSTGVGVSYGQRHSNIRSEYDYTAVSFNTKLAF